MPATYKAVEISAPGQFSLVERTLPEPGPRQVRIRVEACGVCHSDAATVNGGIPGMTYPRVPGHEIIGRIDMVGSDAGTWKVGRRVGLGFFGGEDGSCEACRRGDFVNCANPIIPGVTVDGGYAEMVIAEARALATIPESLNAAEAAPLLCAGVTTFNALRNAGLRAGDLVAVQGLGGLGHLGIQFANRMGFRTVAIGRGLDNEVLAVELGADQYIDSQSRDAMKVLQGMGGAKAILATAPSGSAMSALVPALASRGKLIVVGVPSDPLEIHARSLIFGARTIAGSLSGTAMDADDAIAFSMLQQVRPMIETLPLAQAAEAYRRMMSGTVRFRMVLLTGQ